MREVFVSWKDQLEWMENIACAGGSTCYEEVRSEMWDGLYDKYGQHANFDVEQIPQDKIDQFLDWLENPDEEE
jgi:hypothetical protein